MRITSLRVRGFRSLRDVEFPIGRLTILIGPNGSGKSSALNALRLFFEPSRSVADEDFWRGGADEKTDEIRIAVTLTGLSTEDESHFAGFVNSEGNLTIERVFLEAGQGAYVGTAPGRPEFAKVRTSPMGHRHQFDQLVATGMFSGLMRAQNKVDALQKMSEWELNNPSECLPIPQEVDFPRLDASEPSAIRRRMQLAFIGALEDPETHVGGGAMGALLESVTDFSDLTDEFTEVTEEAKGQIATALSNQKDGFDEIRAVIERAMGTFAHGYSVGLEWSEPRLPTPPLPKLTVSLVDPDGLHSGLSRQGHGIQRSLMLGLLTAQAELGTSESSRTTVVAIEEPEAFQHPLSARALGRVLDALSQDSHQILYSTHSPHLVPAQAAAGMRLFDRGPSAHHAGKETTIKVFSLDSLRISQERATGRTGFTNESTLARLEANLDSRVMEGIFSRLVVLVEGDEDEALIRGAAVQARWDLDQAGVSVVQSRGKTSMPLFLAFFLEVGVPTYPIFDLDRHRTAEQRSGGDQAEAAIMSHLSITNHGDLEESSISHSFACWHEDFGRQVKAEIGDRFEVAETRVCLELGYPVKQGRKVGPVIQAVLDECYQAGELSGSLDELLATLRRRTNSTRGTSGATSPTAET